MVAKVKDAKPTIKETLALLRKDKVRIGFEEYDAEPKFYSTGNMVIDTLSNGGLPVGKIVELQGPEASGKTTTAVHAAAKIIEQGGIVAYFDYERAIDKPYFRELGVDVDDEEHFLYFAPKTIEEGSNTLRKLVPTGELSMAIFDSVAAMVSQHELEADTGAVRPGENAKMIKQMINQVKGDLSDNGTTLVFINHLLEKLDMTFFGQKLAARGIKQYTTPGGKAIPFFASLRLRYAMGEELTQELFDPITNEIVKVKVGSKHRVTVIKNKVGKPGGTAEVVNVLGEGFSQIRTAFDILVSYDAIKKNGAWYSAKDERLVRVMGDGLVQGEKAMLEKVTHNSFIRATAITVAYGILAQAVKSMEVDVEDLEFTTDTEE